MTVRFQVFRLCIRTSPTSHVVHQYDYETESGFGIRPKPGSVLQIRLSQSTPQPLLIDALSLPERQRVSCVGRFAQSADWQLNVILLFRFRPCSESFQKRPNLMGVSHTTA